MRRIHLVTVVGVILIALIFAYSQAPQQNTRTAQTGTQAQKNESVKAKKILVKELPKELKGLELRDGVFRLAPGYKFVTKTPTKILVALKNGSRGAYFTCTCIDPLHSSRKPAGSCVALISSRIAWCAAEPFDECEGECEADWGVGDKKVPLAIF